MAKIRIASQIEFVEPGPVLRTRTIARWTNSRARIARGTGSAWSTIRHRQRVAGLKRRNLADPPAGEWHLRELRPVPAIGRGPDPAEHKPMAV